jgi:hypothetical protein
MDLLHRVKLPSVNFTALEAILHLDFVAVSHFLLSREVLAILEHINVDPLAFEVVHFENCQVGPEITLNYLPPILLEDFFDFVRVPWRLHATH